MSVYLHRRRAFVLLNVVLILAGLLLIVRYDGRTGADIGVSLLAAAVVAVLYLWDNYLTFEYNTRQERLETAGLVDIARSRKQVDYAAHVRKAREHVDVMGYSLRAFTDAHQQLLLSRGASGLRTRILVADPATQASKDQERGERYQSGTFAQGVTRVIEVFGNHEPEIEVRVTAVALPEMIFRIEDDMWVGPYLSERASGETVTFHLRKGGWLFADYLEEYDALWGKAKRIADYSLPS